MGINALNLKRMMVSTAKTNTKTSDEGAFNRVFEKSSKTNESNQNTQVKTKDAEKLKNDEPNNCPNKPLSKEEKEVLKQAGMSDDEINSIKSEGDLKETIIKKILNGDIKDNNELNSLLAMLMTLMNGKFDIADYSKIKDFTKENADKLISIISNCVVQGMPGDELTKKAQKQQNFDVLKSPNEILEASNKLKPSEIVQALNSNGDNILKKIQVEFSNILKDNVKDLNINNNDILEKVQPELVNVLKNKLNDVSTSKKEDKDLVKDVKFETKNIQSEKQTNVIAKTDKKSSDANLVMEDNNSKSDEDFLKNLLSNSNNDKISKVTNFMSQFSSIKVENTNVAETGNLVINKNNFSADMIKSIKYMELNNMKDLTVRINPKELGEVVIRLTMEAGAMKATITATNKEAFNLLNSNLSDMTNRLQNNDIKVQSLALNIYNEDTTFFKDGSNNRQSHGEDKGKRNHAVGAISEEKIEDNVSSIDSNVNMLA